VASSIFRVTVQRQPPPDVALAQSLAAGAAALRAGADGNGANGVGARPAPATAGATTAASAATAAGGSAVLRGGPSAATPPGVRNIQESLGDTPVTSGAGNGARAGDGGTPGGARPGYAPDGSRIGRNDPCWCGSGLKYKKCHGR
jgi:preprotein translocase subunit SecA